MPVYRLTVYVSGEVLSQVRHRCWNWGSADLGHEPDFCRWVDALVGGVEFACRHVVRGPRPVLELPIWLPGTLAGRPFVLFRLINTASPFYVCPARGWPTITRTSAWRALVREDPR